MSNYNSEYLYNASGDYGGAFYNMETFIILINLKELINVSESLPKVIATYILRDRAVKAYDTIIQTALYNINDRTMLIDSARYSALYSITDTAGITDELSELLVLASLYDATEIVDEVNQLNEIILSDDFKATDEMSVETFLSLIDSFGLKDLYASLVILLGLTDRIGMTDSEPKSAVSDFIIGVRDNLDNAYDWLIPFNMKVDWNTTDIKVMPPSESTTIEMPGIDGSIIEDTVYKDRLFQIVAFSEDGLTTSEKEELKSKITEILDSTKRQSKKLTVQASGNSFDVKYDGQASITEGPSYVKATIPFRTSPYGYKTFEGELFGSGLVSNDGDAPVGAKHTISGPVTNPSFILGDITYKWSGNVPAGYKLVIDHQMMTCYLQDGFGVKANAMTGLVGTFQKIPARTGVALTATGVPENQITTNWRDRVLW